MLKHHWIWIRAPTTVRERPSFRSNFKNFQSLPRTFRLRLRSFFVLFLILVRDWPILYRYEILEQDFKCMAVVNGITILAYLTNKSTPHNKTKIKQNNDNSNNNINLHSTTAK